MKKWYNIILIISTVLIALMNGLSTLIEFYELFNANLNGLITSVLMVTCLFKMQFIYLIILQIYTNLYKN